MDELFGDILREYGVVGLILILIALCVYLYATSRAKSSDAAAAERSADATAVTAVSNATTKLIEHLLTALDTTKETQHAITETQRAMTATLAEMLTLLKTSVASGAAIGSQIEVSNAVQATAAAASTLASTQMDATQTKILEHLESLKTAIDLLTAALKKGDAVDDESREDILKRLATLEQLLKQKTEKAKENKDEIPNETKPAQTTVKLIGELTSDATPDKPGDSTG